MDWLTFASNIIDSLVWPLACILGIIFLRKQIGNLLASASKVKYNDFVMEFGAQVEKVTNEITRDDPPEENDRNQSDLNSKQNLYKLSLLSPNAAVLSVWRSLEDSAKALIYARGINIDYNVAAPYKLIENLLIKGKIIDTRKGKVFRDLRRLRNKVAHAGDFEILTKQAQDYIDLSLSLKSHIDRLTNETEVSS